MPGTVVRGNPPSLWRVNPCPFDDLPANPSPRSECLWLLPHTDVVPAAGCVASVVAVVPGNYPHDHPIPPRPGKVLGCHGGAPLVPPPVDRLFWHSFGVYAQSQSMRPKMISLFLWCFSRYHCRYPAFTTHRDPEEEAWRHSRHRHRGATQAESEQMGGVHGRERAEGGVHGRGRLLRPTVAATA